MKRIYTLLIVLLFPLSFSYAQEEKPTTKWGCSLSVNDAHAQMADYGEQGLSMDIYGNMTAAGGKKNRSCSFSITPKYYINTQWLVRFEYGFTQIHLVNTNTSYGDQVYYALEVLHDDVKQQIHRFVASAQCNFFTNKRIGFYGGASLQYIKYTDLTRNYSAEERDKATDQLHSWQNATGAVRGGFATGMGVFAGLNVFLNKHISLGTEFSSALLYYKVGGKYSEVYTTYYTPNSAPHTVARFHADSYEGARFTKILSSFNISYWFR